MKNEKRELIYKEEARRALLRADPYVIFCIDNIKPVDAVEVIHGQWEYWAGGLPRCPVCGYEYTDYVECKNYCGNCGAKMDLPQITEQTKDALVKMGEKAHGDGNGYKG